MFSLGTLAAVFSGGLGDIVRAIEGIIAFSEEMKRLQKELAEMVTSSEAFPDGKWPVAAQGSTGSAPQPAGTPPSTPPETTPVEQPQPDSASEPDAAYA